MSKKQFYKIILSFFWKRKVQVIVFFVLGSCTLMFGFIEPFLSAKLLQSLSAILPREILFFSGILLAIGLLEQFMNLVKREQETKLREAITLDTQAFVSEALFSLELKNFDRKGTAFFSSRVNSDSRTTASILSRLNYSFFSSLKSFGVVIYIFAMSAFMGIYIILASLFLFFLRFKRIRKWEEQTKKEEHANETYSSTFTEMIRGIRDIKVLNLKDKMIQKTLEDQKQINFLYQKNRRAMYVYDESEWFFRQIIFFGVLAFAVFLMHYNMFLGTNLLVLYTYRSEAFSFFTSIFHFFEDATEIGHSFQRMYELMDDKTYSKEHFGAVHRDHLSGNIEFQHVSFSYGEKNVLENVSFHIEPNATVGFVGKSGAGKTTIFQLISKLYQIHSGDILLDGVSISQFDEASIRQNISVITQNPYLFNMTIRDNLKIVNPDASEEEMISNCKLCAFHDYVMTLPDGYDTLIGEGGVILSGGLRQRLAIARALMKKSEIILLDEATSALDNETQDFIKKSIQQISKDYTILIIAHRLSTVRDCDYIIVIDEGKVVGVGTHDELIKKNRIYKKLYRHELD